MERLGKWRDKATGINPFVYKEDSLLIYLILGITRLFLLMVLYLLFSLTKLEFIGKLLLYVAGVINIDFKESILQEGPVVRLYSQGKLSISPSHYKNDVIICNCVCWLDKLILQVFFPDGIYLFPEKCPSNNKGVLLFDPEMLKFKEKNQRIRLVGLKYNDYHCKKSFLYFSRCNVIIRTLSPEAIWEASNIPNIDSDEFPKEAQKLIASLVHLKPLQLGFNDFIEFQKHI